MSNQTEHTVVRLRVPPKLKKQIEQAAENNNRSQSAEMVDRLELSFDLNQSIFKHFDQSKEFLNTLNLQNQLIQDQQKTIDELRLMTDKLTETINELIKLHITKAH